MREWLMELQVIFTLQLTFIITGVEALIWLLKSMLQGYFVVQHKSLPTLGLFCLNVLLAFIASKIILYVVLIKGEEFKKDNEDR